MYHIRLPFWSLLLLLNLKEDEVYGNSFYDTTYFFKVKQRIQFVTRNVSETFMPQWCKIQVYLLCRSKTCPKQVSKGLKYIKSTTQWAEKSGLTLTFEHVTWKSIGIIYSLRATPAPSLVLIMWRGQKILSGQHLVYRPTDRPTVAKQYAPFFKMGIKIQYDHSSVDSKCKLNDCISRNTTYGRWGITISYSSFKRRNVQQFRIETFFKFSKAVFIYLIFFIFVCSFKSVFYAPECLFIRFQAKWVELGEKSNKLFLSPWIRKIP